MCPSLPDDGGRARRRRDIAWGAGARSNHRLPAGLDRALRAAR